VQRPIPIWFGGQAEEVLRRASRIGDGWMPNYRTVEQARPALDQLAQFLAEAGRDKASFGLEPRLNMSLVAEEGWTDYLHSWEREGATHLSVNTMGCGFDSPAKHLAALKHFAEAFGL